MKGAKMRRSLRRGKSNRDLSQLLPPACQGVRRCRAKARKLDRSLAADRSIGRHSCVLPEGS